MQDIRSSIAAVACVALLAACSQRTAEGPGPMSDSLQMTPAEREAIPPSPWAQGERERFTTLLHGHSCDTLVVPVQNQHYGFDRITRALMTAQLAQALAADPQRCVVDPFLAARALGDGLRRIPEADVVALANAVSARSVVRVYAGHDGKGKLEILLKADRAEGDAAQRHYVPALKQGWDEVVFSDAQPPFVAWKPLLPKMLAALEAKPIATVALAADPSPTLPASPPELVSGDAAQAAPRYGLLAALGPADDVPAIERLHEKAWLAADAVANDAAARRWRARALFHLGFRPAALAALGDDRTAEGVLLRALLDGNLDQAETALSQATSPLERIEGEFEVADLQAVYRPDQVRTAAPEALLQAAGPSQAWAWLFALRVHEADPAFIRSNEALLPLLQQALPLPPEPAGAAPDPASTNPELGPARYARQALARMPQEFCCASFTLRPQKLDYLDLLEARAQNNLEKAIVHAGAVQGQYDGALALLDADDAVYAGHPHFAALRLALHQMLLSRHDAGASSRDAAAPALARTAVWQEQALTTYSFAGMTAMGIPSRASRPYIAAYGTDFPPRPYWRGWHKSGAEAWPELLRKLDYASVPDNSLLQELVSGTTPKLKSDVDKIFRERFRGSPLASRWRLQLASAQDGAAGKIAGLREAIAQQPQEWQPYSLLATELIHRGAFDEATQLVQGYPGFRPGSDVDPVALATYVHEVARQLYWCGAVEQAKTLYAIGARYTGGGAANLLAQQRVANLDGDLAKSAQLALQRVQQYADPYSMSEWLELTFAGGAGKKAWPAFFELAARYAEAEFWKVALVGLRAEGRDDAAVRVWLGQETVRGIVVGLDRPAVELGLNAFMLDRDPPDDLAAFLATLEGPPETRTDGSFSVRRGPLGSTWQRHRSRWKTGEPRSGEVGEVVPSAYVMLAEALVKQHHGDDAGAVAAMARMANYYAVESGEMNFALPYLAFSAARSGDSRHVGALVEELEGTERNYYALLASAVFAGEAKDHDAALDQLQQARRRIPLDQVGAQLPAFQLAQTALWLYRDTGETRYRDLALDWARINQRMAPARAWSFALEAHYGDATATSYTRAVALATYLDPHSRLLAEVPAPALTAAKAWLKKNNPFPPIGAAMH